MSRSVDPRPWSNRRNYPTPRVQDSRWTGHPLCTRCLRSLASTIKERKKETSIDIGDRTTAQTAHVHAHPFPSRLRYRSLYYTPYRSPVAHLRPLWAPDPQTCNRPPFAPRPRQTASCQPQPQLRPHCQNFQGKLLCSQTLSSLNTNNNIH